MATDREFIDYILEQVESLENITAKKMFGEYAVFANKKIFGLVCDNKLFIKPTESGRAYIKDLVEAPPYPGAKNSFLKEDKIEDREWLCELIRISLPELPEPKPRKKKKK